MIVINWQALLAWLGSTAVLIGALTWLAKTLAEHVLDRDLKHYEEALKHAHAQALARLQSDYAKELARYQRALASEGARQERLAKEIVKWTNPIMGAIDSLDHRLKNILVDGGYPALRATATPRAWHHRLRQRLRPPLGDWSITYDYFMPSTLFVFGQYFCWIGLLYERLSFELFDSIQQREDFFAAMWAVSKPLSSFPAEYIDATGQTRCLACTGPDMQVFALQQRGIGEALRSGEGGTPQCLSYAAFLERWETDPVLRLQLAPLRRFLEGLTPHDDCRWQRLEQTRHALARLKTRWEDQTVRRPVPDPETPTQGHPEEGRGGAAGALRTKIQARLRWRAPNHTVP